MSRWAALLSVIALFIAGISIGALGAHLFLGRRVPGPPPPPIFTREMEEQLNLTQEQRQQIRVFLNEGRRRGDEIRREVRPRLERLIEEIRQKITTVLTPEQQARFEELRREQRARADRFFLGDLPPRPPPPDGGPLPWDGGPPPPRGGPPPPDGDPPGPD